MGGTAAVLEEICDFALTFAETGVYISFSGVRPERCFSDVNMYATRHDNLAKRMAKTPCAGTVAWGFVAFGGGRDVHVSDIRTGGGP